MLRLIVVGGDVLWYAGYWAAWAMLTLWCAGLLPKGWDASQTGCPRYMHWQV